MMHITCNNCHKKFDIESSLIPDKGRLLQCNICNHKWFYKKDHIENFKINNIIEDTTVLKNKSKLLPIKSPKIFDLFETQTKDSPIIEKISINKSKEDKDDDINFNVHFSKNKKNYNILSLIILFIISFISLIIVVDTFQIPLSKLVPNVEFLLYSLYETIRDIGLFLKDLT
jgi:predicted Zn finger-like uncharacterized protein|tara:strand:+ start:34 stop:549 length:516 start_codon:yes stop_codon:yes gene_type:complete